MHNNDYPIKTVLAREKTHHWYNHIQNHTIKSRSILQFIQYTPLKLTYGHII